MLTIRYENTVKKQLKLLVKRGKDKTKLIETLNVLATEKTLPLEYQDRALKGKYLGFRECYIEADWLLMYKIDHGKQTLVAIATGNYADLLQG